MAVTLSNSQISAGLYSAFWNRAPDATGQNFWVGKLNGGMSSLQVATEFYNAPEGLAAYPNWIRDDNAALVTQVYNSVFERAPDPAGLAFYVAQLNAGTSFPQVVLNMMTNALNSAAAGNTDGMQFANEIEVGIYVAETLRTDDPAITSVALDGVTYEQSSVAIREAQLDEMVDPANTRILTTNIDIATAQYFDGSLNSNGQMTLQNFDQLTGQKDWNKLDAELLSGNSRSGTVTYVTPELLENIQVIDVTVVPDRIEYSYQSGATLDLRNADAVEVLVNDGSVADLTFNNVGGTLTDVAVNNTASYTTVNLAAAADLTEVNLNLSNNRTGAKVTIPTAETINISSNTLASTVNLDFDAATSLTIDGNADLTATMTAATNSVSSVDASLFEGDLDLTMSAQTGVLGTTVVTVNSGLGNDTINVNAVTQRYNVALGEGDDTVVDTGITDSDSIEGGDGIDTLSTYSARVIASGLTTANGVNGIDILEVADKLTGNVTLATIDSTINQLDLSADATDEALNSTGGVTVTGPAGTLTVNLGSDTNANGVLAGNLTLVDTGTGTADSLVINNLAEDGSGTNLDVFAGKTITSTGYENVAINTGSATNATDNQDITDLIITADAASANVSVTFTGTNAVDVTLVDTNSTGLTTIDASGLEVLTSGLGLAIGGTDLGALGTQSIIGSAGRDSVVVGNFAATIDGGTGNDTLTGGTLSDHLHGGEGDDSLTGSGGNDTIHGNEGNDTIDANSVAAYSETRDAEIEGGAGNDTVRLGATLTTKDVVDGGEGVDTLSVTRDITGTTGVGVTNFERLQTTLSQAMTDTVNNTGWTTVFADGAGITISNALSTLTTYQVDNSSTGTQELSRLTDTGTDSLTIQAYQPDNTLAANDIAIANFNAVDEESITIDNSAGTARSTTNGLVITNLDADDLTSLTLTGDNKITIENAIIHGTKLATINASAMTAAVDVDASTSNVALTATGAAAYANTITTGTGADSITGGSAADNLTGNNGADTLVGNAGNDVLLSGQGADSISAGTGTDSVTAGTGADSVTLSVDGETDTINQAASDSIAATATNFSGATFAAGDTITFGNGVDVINNFKAGTLASGGDVLNVGTSVSTSLLNGSTSSTTVGWLSGTYSGGVFTVAANGVGPDTLVLQASSLSGATTRAVVLAGVDTDNLDNANFSGTTTWNPTAAIAVNAATGAFTSTDTTYTTAAQARAAGIYVVQGSAGGVNDEVVATGNTANTTFNFSTGALSGGAGDSVNDLVYADFNRYSGATAYTNTVTDAAGAQAITLANTANGTNTLTFSGGGADTVANTSTNGTTTGTVSAASGSVTVTDSGTHSNAYTLSGAAHLVLNTSATTGSDTITVGASGGELDYTNSGGGRTGGATVTFNRAIAGTDTVAMGTSTGAELVLNVAQSTANAAQGMSDVDTLTLGASGGAYTITTASGDLSSTATVRNASAVILGNVTLNTAATSAGVTVDLTTGSAAYASTGSFTLNGGYVNSVTSGTGGDSVTVAALDGNIVTGTAALTTSLSTGTNTVTATVTGALAAEELQIIGTTGTDTLTLARSTNVAIVANAGDIVKQNTVNITGTSTSGFEWTTGAGDATEATIVAIASGITGTKTVNMATGTTGAVTASFYDLAAESNTFITGSGNDVLTVYQSDTNAITTGDKLKGGTGSDELKIDLNNNALTVDLSGDDDVSGFDTITLTNTGSTNNDALVLTVKNTSAAQGAELVTINASLLQGTVSISNVSGTTAQTITGNTSAAATVVGGTGADTLLFTASTTTDITGGVGADQVYAGTSTATVRLATDDSGTNASSGSFIGTAAFDVYRNVGVNDVLKITATGYSAGWTAASTSSDVAGDDETIIFCRGTYDAANNVFTAGVAGTDTLATWDVDGGATDTFNSIVLVGFVGTATDSYNANVHTLTLT